MGDFFLMDKKSIKYEKNYLLTVPNIIKDKWNMWDSIESGGNIERKREEGEINEEQIMCIINYKSLLFQYWLIIPTWSNK